MNKPYIRSLNDNQHKLLAAIYSFRFSTRSLLSEYCGVPNNTSFYSRLQILQKHDYIATHYDKDYKLAGREAEFYILPKGLRALREAKTLDVTDAMLTAVYKDKVVGQDFIKQQVLLMRIRNALAGTYESLRAFTARDTQAFDYFPNPRPGLFVSMKNSGDTMRFFLEYVPANAATSKLRKRLEYYTRYHEESSWSDTGTLFPNILLIAETGLVEAGVQRAVRREQYRSDTEIGYYTTTQKAILGMTPTSQEIWTNVVETDELIPLQEIEA